MTTTEALLKEGVYQRGFRDGAGQRPQDKELQTAPHSTKRVRRWYAMGYEDGRMMRLAAFAKLHLVVQYPGLVGFHRGSGAPEREAVAKQLAEGNKAVGDFCWSRAMLEADHREDFTAAKRELTKHMDPALTSGHWRKVRRWLRNLPLDEMSEDLLKHAVWLIGPWRANLRGAHGRLLGELQRRSDGAEASAQA